VTEAETIVSDYLQRLGKRDGVRLDAGFRRRRRL
jgi:hypothetical protein